MKKILRFLKKITPMLALAVMMMAPMWGWGQTTYTFSSKSWAASPADWTSKKDGLAYQTNQGIQVSTGATGACGNSPISYANVTSVKVGYCTNASSGAGTINVFSVADANAAAQSGTRIGTSTSVSTSGGTTVRYLTFNTTAVTGNIQIYVTCTTNSIYIYSVEITYASGPTITVNPATLNDFTYELGSGPSAEQNFTVEGSNLTANISIAATANYEISKTSGSGFATPLIFTQTGGTVTEQTIYVRLKAGLDAGDYNNEVITATSTGADNKTVTCSGSVTAPPAPDAPVATAATAVGSNGFTANWNASAGATGYFLDVYTITGSGNATDLFISEYGEGSGNNKYIEIYNGTGSTVDLSEYVLKQSYNGGGWSGDPYSSYNLSLSGTLANNDVYVIANSGANASILAQADIAIVYSTSTPGGTVVTFTGNDAMGLFKNGVLIDVFGDPTSSATIPVAGFSTYGKDHTIVRKSSINAGNTDWTSSSGTNTTDSEWIGYAQDTWTYLGSHTMDGGSTQTYVSGYENLDVGNVTSYAVTTLSSATTYFYVVRATNASGTSGNSNEISVATLASPVTSTYTGTGTWTNASNWSNGLPGETTDVTIDGNVTINVVAECNDMTISPTGAVTVGAGKELYVLNNLLIESNATGTGSFIGAAADYAIGETTTIQRYLTGGWDGWDAGWHQLSSPVAAQSISAFATGSYDFYGWEESTNMWMNYKAAGFAAWNGSLNFNVGQGYLVSYEAANTTQTFIGELNTTDVTRANLTTNGGSYDGWNLLGNPFASALKWNDANWTLNNVAGVAKIWSEAGKSYSDVEASTGIIPSAQGFMVQVSSATSLTIPAASRVHDATPFYKSGNEKLVLVAAETEGGSAQESKIIVNPIATEGFDFDYDSRFLAGYAPLLYSVVGDEMLSTNSLPELTSGKVIPFGFVKNAATTFTIKLKESIPGTQVYLTDKKTDIVTNLTETPVYSFTSSEGDDPNRFELKFGAVGIDDNIATKQTSIYSNGQLVYISSTKSANALINIYNVTGQQVYANTMVIDGQKQIALNTPTGWYIVKVTTATGVATQKVFIKSN